MIGFNDFLNDMVEKKEDGMPHLNVKKEARDEVESLLEKAKAILKKAGVEDPAKYISDYCEGEMGMEGDPEDEPEASAGKEKRATLIMAILNKKKDGASEEESESEGEEE